MSQIEAKIIAASVSLGIGAVRGGVGASIGVAVAENSIGYDAGGTLSPMQVMAYAQDSGISAKGAYTLTANSDQQINALILALSAAVAGGTGVGLAASGSGAEATNQVAVDAQAYQNGGGSGPGARHLRFLHYCHCRRHLDHRRQRRGGLLGRLRGRRCRRVGLHRRLAGQQHDRQRRGIVHRQRDPGRDDHQRRDLPDINRRARRSRRPR